MTYSFTKATSKHVLKAATKIWAFYFLLAFGILLCFKIVLLKQIEGLKDRQIMMKSQQENIVKVTDSLRQEGERLHYELGVANKITERDNKLRQQIKNILDMIPDGVVATEIRFDNTSLLIRGITVSRELFETSLQSQLRSIYATSNASFYELPSGWHNFESISQTRSDDGLLERIDQIN